MTDKQNELVAVLRTLLAEAKDWAEVMCGERPSLDEAVALAEAAIAKASPLPPMGTESGVGRA